MLKKMMAVAMGAALVLMITACSDQPTTTAPQVHAQATQLATGNGAPSGAHYNLNIIGAPKGKNPDMTGDNGHRIFVSLSGQTKILLTEGEFAVLDANGTDGQAAFQLPNPDPDMDGTTSYSVYVRALGKPGNSAWMQSCYTDDTGTWCALDFAGGVDSVTIARTKGGVAKFQNVSKDLLYIDYCTSWDTSGETPVCLHVTQMPLFGEDLQEYFWQYNNDGLKVAQMRFYELPTVTGWTPGT